MTRTVIEAKEMAFYRERNDLIIRIEDESGQGVVFARFNYTKTGGIYRLKDITEAIEKKRKIWKV